MSQRPVTQTPPAQGCGSEIVNLEQVLVGIETGSSQVVIHRPGQPLLSDHEPENGAPLLWRHAGQIGVERQSELTFFDALP